MKILFLAGAYHPRYSANGICVKNVVDACVRCGFDVTCIVNGSAGCRKVEHLDGALIKRVRPRWIIRWQQWRQGREDSRLLRTADAVATNLNRIKMLAMSAFWPLVSPLYTYRFYRAGKRELDVERYDALVAVYTPIDALLAGCLLKRKHSEVTFIPYYLDALAGGWGPARWPSDKTDRKARRWEEVADRSADVIVSMESSRGYHESHPLGGDAQKKRTYLDVPLMVDRATRTGRRIAPSSDRPYALFAGNIPFPRRDPRPALELMLRVCERCDMDFIIAGECSDPSLLDGYAERSGGRIRPIGQQSRERIDELESGAAVLVNMGSRNPNTIPGKIFEYIGHLKPIISTYVSEDEPSIPYLREYGHSLFVNEALTGDDGTVEMVCSFVEAYRTRAIPEDACAGRFYANRPEAFADLLKERLTENAQA